MQIADFSAKVLPLYFKHSRWTSFVRQLHIYGFKKWADRKGDNQVEFRNPQFTRAGRDVLHTIKRRVIPANSDTSDPSKPRAKRRRRTTTTLTNDQARLLMVTLAKQEEVLQKALGLMQRFSFDVMDACIGDQQGKLDNDDLKQLCIYKGLYQPLASRMKMLKVLSKDGVFLAEQSG